jgi:hypothetical protein
VNGRTRLIIPSYYHESSFFEGGKLYRIPGAGEIYTFLLHRPFGVEFIKAIACTTPFSDVEESYVDLGPATRGLLGRGLSVTPKVNPEIAEALVTYTIVGR